MTVTFLGDSLTAGNLGVSFLDYLSLPAGVEIVNCGRDGDTVLGVRGRLDDVLAADYPDILVIEAGANDILQPEMSLRGGDWGPFIAKMTAQGSVPSPVPDDFESAYAELIAAAVRLVPETVCMTIPPVGEDPLSGRNRIRGELNRRIRRAVGAARASLVDAAALFEAELATLEAPSDYFFGYPSEFAADARRVRREGADALSTERGLMFTMDGAHLNHRGARLLADLVSRSLFQARR